MPKNSLTGQNGQYRKDIYRGCLCDIVLKQNQASGKLTRGIVKDILTSKQYHPRGIKVRLDIPNVLDIYRVGRVQYIIENKKIILKPNNQLENNIKELKKYKLNINFKDSKKKLTWLHIDNVNMQNTMFQVMRKYKEYNICAIFTIENNEIIRLEYYEKNKLIYDLKRLDLYF